MESLIRLFRAVPVESTKKGDLDKGVMAQTIKDGFIFSERIFANYTRAELLVLVSKVKKELGLNAKEMNNSFHKTWKKIATATDEQLFTEQIIHYFTTYGLESLGLYDKDCIFIPDEVLKLPRTNPNKLKLIIINGYTKKEIKEKIIALLQTGIAMKEDTIKDMVEVALYVELTKKEILLVKNKEVKISLYELLNMIPENAVEFMRYLVYTTTKKTLLIKNKITFEAIKTEENARIVNVLLYQYKQEYGLKPLAEIFNRFKPLFMACRTSGVSKRMINEISRLSKTEHKPMAEDYLNTVTAKIVLGVEINLPRLGEELSKVNIFRKIRLAYALNYRTKDVDSILYKVRNGKGYATSFDFKHKQSASMVLETVMNSIIKDIKPQVEGKKIYIPENIKYALPATEKQFTGNLPSGSYISIPKDMILGVHWEDIEENRIDLDFSISNIEGKYGWDGGYRSDEGGILFSGDITSAPKPKGATELFYIKRQVDKSFIVMLNYFNYDRDTPIPFKFFIAQQKIDAMRQGYMVNPTNILVNIECKIEQKQKMLGLLIATKEGCKFYFSEAYLGNSISSSNSEYSENSRKYLLAYNTNIITLNDILVKAGAKAVGTKKESDIDLSPESLQKDTIIKLLSS